ncbi:MAG: methyltransferase FkbM family [Rubritepida sp.]|nr:methyltransferase FkbM family [Rubritepida sp.]
MNLPSDFSAAIQRHGARLSSALDGVFVLSDSAVSGWQIIEMPHRDLLRATVRFRLSIRPIGEGKADFCVHHALGMELARVGRDGTLIHSDPNFLKDYSFQQGESGWLDLDFLFFNQAPAVIFGLTRPTSRYTGSNTPQFELKTPQLEVVESRWTPTQQDPLRIVEIGTRTAADPVWQPFAEGLRIMAFTPLPSEVEALRTQLPADRGHVVIGKALSDRNGTSPFSITKVSGYSSIFKPDFQRLKGYAAADDFQLVSESKVETCRFDAFVKQGDAVPPDVIRINAPGFEYNALRGFGDALDQVLAVEVQLYVYPVYKKQKLLGDIVDLLESSGLLLRRALPPAKRPYARFSNEVMQMTGLFMRKRPSDESRGRHELMEEIWGLPPAP